MCRLYIESALSTGMEVTLNDEQQHYLRRVMRLHAGDPVLLFNGQGGEYEALIISRGKSDMACRIGKCFTVDREMPGEVHIVQATSRNEKIESVLQKGTELGAAGFQIVACERSSLKLPEGKLDSRLRRWRKIIIEAAEQSGRTRIPALHWRQSLADIRLAGQSYALHPLATLSWRQVRERIAQANYISFVIGPEGGLSARDLQILAELKCETLAFGPRIMRTETAAPALLAAVQAVQEEPSG